MLVAFTNFSQSTAIESAMWTYLRGGSVTDPDGVSSETVLAMDQQNENYNWDDNVLSLPGPTTDTMGVGCRLFFKNLPPNTGASTCVGFKGTDNVQMVWYQIECNGAVSIYSRDYITGLPVLEDTTDPLVMTTRCWPHFELKFNPATDAYELRRDGITVLSGTVTASLYNGGEISHVWFSPRTNNGFDTGDCYMKDFVVWDGSGSYNNNFLGPVRVISINPDSDVSSGWVPSTGSDDYPLISDGNAGTNIAADDTLPAASITTLSNLGSNTHVVKGIGLSVYSSKSDSAAASLVPALVSGATTSNGATVSPATTGSVSFDIWDSDPDTSAAWTKTGINGLKVSLNRTV